MGDDTFRQGVLKMSKEITIKEYSQADIQKYICPNATEQEFFTFCQIVKARKLNPFLKEVHFVKYGNSPGQIVVGKDAIIKRAKKIEGYRGFKAGWFGEAGERLEFPIGDIKGAWCEVYSIDNEPLFVSVLMSEYCSNQATWKAKPATMIRKVAVVQAHREFSPEETSGLYDADELSKEPEQPKTKAQESETIADKFKKQKEPEAAEKDKTRVEILKEIVEDPEYKNAIQAILKEKRTAPESLRTEDEKTAEQVCDLIIQQKGFEEAEINEIIKDEEYF